MARDDLEKSATGLRSAADRLLRLLKTRGEMTSTDCAAVLGVSAEAVRQQLTRMSGEGLVVATADPQGVGRPAQFWQLTAEGHARFPDTHSELTVSLIQSIRSELGQATLDRLIALRGQANVDAYLKEMADAKTLAERVRLLAKIRSREGYLAEWHKDGQAYVLIENHCPICAAATECQGFCRTELETFRKVLGSGAEVVREEHIVDGDRRCAYRIRRVAKK